MFIERLVTSIAITSRMHGRLSRPRALIPYSFLAPIARYIAPAILAVRGRDAAIV